MACRISLLVWSLGALVLGGLAPPVAVLVV